MSSPEHLYHPGEPLADLLRSRRVAALIADAELIRDAPIDSDRDDEARRYVREAMLLFALHRITREQRDRILDILSFAVPDTRPDIETLPGADIDSPASHGPFG